jgi:hypothetical protein
MKILADHDLVIPNLAHRTSGRWLAVVPFGALFSISVTASTESEAKEKFCSVYNRWIEIRETGERENTLRTQYTVIRLILLKEL